MKRLSKGLILGGYDFRLDYVKTLPAECEFVRAFNDGYRDYVLFKNSEYYYLKAPHTISRYPLSTSFDWFLKYGKEYKRLKI